MSHSYNDRSKYRSPLYAGKIRNRCCDRDAFGPGSKRFYKKYARRRRRREGRREISLQTTENFDEGRAVLY